MKIIYLKPLGGYATDLRSDTLWGMLCWGIRHLWGEAELTRFIEGCAAGQPDFVISSTFPYKQYAKAKIPFFPNPLVLFPKTAQADTNTAIENARLLKVFKRLEYIDLDDFGDILNGRLTAEGLLERLRVQFRARQKAQEDKLEYLPSQAERDRYAPEREAYSMTHNTINRRRGGTLELLDSEGEPAGQLFHAEETYWTDAFGDEKRPSTGIFFLAEGNTEKLEAVLRLFRHWGFGADRTVGKGFFDFEISDFDLPEAPASEANALLNLSLYHPTPGEAQAIDQSNGYKQYRFETRAGYVGHHSVYLRKQPVRYFAEGSIFPMLPGFASRQLGQLFAQDQCAQHLSHGVWDNGFGFMARMIVVNDE